MCRFIFPSDEDDEEGQEGVDTGRVRRPGSITTLHDGDTTLPLECPPGYALSPSAPPALDSPLVKRHIILRRGLEWG